MGDEAGYDTSPSVFSPEGRLFQVKYAKAATKISSTAIGLKSRHGVVIAAEKLIFSPLYESASNNRICKIDEHVGMTFTGWYPDALKITELARAEAVHYYFSHHIESSDLISSHLSPPFTYPVEYSMSDCQFSLQTAKIPIKLLQERLSMYFHMYTLYTALRIFGCSIILGGYDADGPHLYSIDPSGASHGYHACVIGKETSQAKAALAGLSDIEEMSMLDMAKEAARIIYEIHDEVRDKPFQLELGWVGEDTNGTFEPVPQLLFELAETYAKEAIQDNASNEDNTNYQNQELGNENQESNNNQQDEQSKSNENEESNENLKN